VSSEKTLSVTRVELYRRVWSTPMRTLAKEFRLSDVGLAKICEKHQIPRPPVGHWVRVERGYDPEKIPLPILQTRSSMSSTLRSAKGRSTLSGKISIRRSERCWSQRRS
jgi:hypothetical protein